jgi:opacity protein-like surface antigen
MKETVMKKIFAVVVGLMMLLMLSGVSLSAEPAEPAAAPAKHKPAKVAKVKKEQHLKKSQLTKGFDVSVNGGVSFLTDSDVSGAKSATVEFDKGYAFNVAAGYRLGGKFHPIRVEAELGYQKNDVDKCDANCKNISGDMKAYTFLMNGYYDFVHGHKLVPYLTAGIGVAKVDAKVNNFAHVDDTGLAYQVGVGLAYHLSDNWHLDLRYRYLAVADLDGYRITSMNPEFASHNILLGLRYRF